MACQDTHPPPRIGPQAAPVHFAAPSGTFTKKYTITKIVSRWLEESLVGGWICNACTHARPACATAAIVSPCCGPQTAHGVVVHESSLNPPSWPFVCVQLGTGRYGEVYECMEQVRTKPMAYALTGIHAHLRTHTRGHTHRHTYSLHAHAQVCPTGTSLHASIDTSALQRPLAHSVAPTQRDPSRRVQKRPSQ
jgi:hypothetical protein